MIQPVFSQPVPPPVISITAFKGNIAICYGPPSASFQQFVVSGSSLTSKIMLSVSIGFQISLNSIAGYDSTISLTPSTGSVLSTNIYIRTAANAVPGNLTGIVSISSDGAITQNVTVTAIVYAYPVKPIISSSRPLPMCNGDSTMLRSNIVGGNQWFLNGAPIQNENKDNYVAKKAGDYSIINTNIGGCSTNSTTTTISLKALPFAPTISSINETTFCSGQTDTLLSNNGTSIQWLINGSPIANATSTNYIVATTGNYSAVNIEGGCTSIASTTITVTVIPVPQIPIITAAGSTIVCSGTGLLLTSSAAVGNQWYYNGNSILGANNNTYVAINGGIYSVVSTTSICTSKVSSTTIITVGESAISPVLNAGGPIIFCDGVSVVLTSSKKSGNQWYKNSTLISGAIDDKYTVTSTGTYSLVTTLNGCSSVADNPIVVSVNPLPPKPAILSNNGLNICKGDSTILSSSVLEGNQWFLDGKLLNSAINYTIRSAGNYIDTVTNQYGCKTASSIINVKVSPLPVANFTINTPSQCFKNNYYLFSNKSTVSDSSLNLSQFLWTFGDTGKSTQLSPNYTYGSPGSYIVKLLILTPIGCKDSITSNVSVNPSPTVDRPLLKEFTTDTTICFYDSLLISSKNLYDKYLWSTGDSSGSVVIKKSTKVFLKIGTKFPVCYSNSSMVVMAHKNITPTPSITRLADDLISSQSLKYSWVFNNISSVKDSAKVLNLNSKGLYRVKTSIDNLCWTTSNDFYVQTDPIKISQNDYELLAFPNPTNGLFFLQIKLDRKYSGFVQFSVFDPMGALKWNINKFIFNDIRVKIPFNLHFVQGVYTIQVNINGYKTKALQVIGL